MAETSEGVKFDLLLKGGRVLDPGRGLDAQLDIGITAGTIVAVASGLDEREATEVIWAGGRDRYVVPGLIDMHTHVAAGATTPGVELVGGCEPDAIGVEAGVTTVLDAGSVGIANIGAFASQIQPRSKTRVLSFLAAGSTPDAVHIKSLSEVSRDGIAACIAANPGLVSGLKMRLHGQLMYEQGEQLVDLVTSIAREHALPVMVHIGDHGGRSRPHPDRLQEVTRYLLRTLDVGDIVTHLCTPHEGGVLDRAARPIPELQEAHERGVVLDAGLGRENFGYRVAERQAQFGIHADTISSDTAIRGITFRSLVECMSLFMALGYSFPDVIRMTTASPARVIGLADTLGAIAVGREADLTVLDLHRADFQFRDSVADTGETFRGEYGIAPVLTIRRGSAITPRWGTHPWGWLPELA